MHALLSRFSLLLIVIFSYSSLLKAQNNPPKNFVVRGNVKNAKEKFWELSLTTFYNDKEVSLAIDTKGNFSKTIELTNPQNLFLVLNDDAINLFVVPGDTLTINWDDNDFKSTFKVKAQDKNRQNELDLMLELYRNYRVQTINLMKEMYNNKVSEQEKIDQVQKLYSAYLNTTEKYDLVLNGNKINADIYYLFLHKFVDKINKNAKKLGQNTYSQYKLTPPKSFGSFVPVAPLETLIDERIFLISPQYREYILDRTRFNNAFISISKIEENKQQDDQWNSTLNDCYSGMVSLYMSEMIRDWYLVTSIISGYEFYGFNNSEIAYQKFRPEIKTAEYLDTLEKFHTNIQRLKSGNDAPDFQLKDNNGKTVSLSNFRGKIVYIDFWGVHCGACIIDIEGNATKVHKKYKDVVFINVCVDVEEKEWKKSLKTLELEGINVLAKGWINNQVCKDYGINAIPHYVLIDKQGKLINNSAPRLYELAGDGSNELDLLIKQSK